MSAEDIEARIRAISRRGVVVIDPRQTYVDAEVRPERLEAGAVLHPGVRLRGPRTYLSAGAELGREGPVTVEDCVLGERARIDGGFARGAVLLGGASLGAGAHVRAGTLLEEQASTAHTVGLKHTILMSFVTVGSLINFCDVLIAGGTSRRDHSEVGSGFIHFNFTPWGEHGDKATASLVGDVVDGVFLRQPRIFLGGAGGMVGPRRIGYGAVTAAGQVIRADVGPERLSLQPGRPVDARQAPGRLDEAEPRARRNLAYISQLVALRSWYRHVRLRRAQAQELAGECAVLEAAEETLGLALEERSARLRAFLLERAVAMPEIRLDPPMAPCPLPLKRAGDHITWVQSLGPREVADGRAWLGEAAEMALEAVPADLRPQPPWGAPLSS